MKKKYLVLGANSYLGGHLYKELVDYYPGSVEPYGSYRTNSPGLPGVFHADLTLGMDVDAIMRVIRPDVIFLVSSAPQRDPDCLVNNLLMTRNVLRFAPDGCRIVYISSSTVYGDLAGKVNRGCVESDPVAPTSDYGRSKCKGEALVLEETSRGRIRSTIIRPCAIIGRCRPHGLLADLVRKVTDPNISRLVLLGNSTDEGSWKPYVYVDDVVQALTYLATEEIDGTFNIAPNDQMSVGNIANLVMKELGVTKDIVWDEDNEALIGDNPYVNLDSSKLINEGFSFKHQTSYSAVGQSIKEYIRWAKINGV